MVKICKFDGTVMNENVRSYEQFDIVVYTCPKCGNCYIRKIRQELKK